MYMELLTYESPRYRYLSVCNRESSLVFKNYSGKMLISNEGMY